MAISPQRLTIYLYSAHRAVIFAVAQLSCSAVIFARFRLTTGTLGKYSLIEEFSLLCNTEQKSKQALA